MFGRYEREMVLEQLHHSKEMASDAKDLGTAPATDSVWEQIYGRQRQLDINVNGGDAGKVCLFETSSIKARPNYLQ